jgi:hypothetical protein
VEANYLTGNIRCLVIAKINLHPIRGFYYTATFDGIVYRGCAIIDRVLQ